MTRLLLTGASGFVGSHALRHFLLKTDWHIVCPVSFRHKGLPRRIVSAVAGLDTSRITIVRCDLAAPIDKVTIHEMGVPNYVVNYASQSHVDRSISDPVPFVLNNINVMLNLLEYARRWDTLQAFVQISTDEVYGPAPLGTQHREWSVIAPSNPYSASKASQEALAFSYWRTYGVPVAIVNCMNLIGEMQDAEKFVPTVMRCLMAETPVTLHGGFKEDGEVFFGSRYYLHARNLADAVLYILTELTAPVRYGVNNCTLLDRYNVVGEKELSNLEMAQLIATAMGKMLDYTVVDFHTQRPGHDLRYALSGYKLQGLGWRRPYTLEKSLEHTVQWTMRHKEWL